METARMLLNEMQCRNAKPGTKLNDGNGLTFHATEAGNKLWRFRYPFDGKDQTLSLGKYPAVSIKKARQKRDEARALLADDINPSAHRKKQKLMKRMGGDDTFTIIGMRYLNTQKHGWTEDHYKKTLSMFKRYLEPDLGRFSITEIESPMVLSVLRKVEAVEKYDLAHRLKWVTGGIFRFAAAEGIKVSDVTYNLKGALIPKKTEHLAAITEPKAFGRLLLAIDTYQGTPIVESALKLAPLLCLRMKELRMLEYSEIDFEKRMITILGEKMKANEDLLVPLCDQSMEIILHIKKYTGDGKYVCPSARSPHRPMSENAVRLGIRALGYPKGTMTGHGFRACIRTLAVEQLKVPAEYVEMQLGHRVKDPLGRSYNRATFIEDRIKFMAQWADYLDVLKAEALRAMQGHKNDVASRNLDIGAGDVS
jgi:integrase